MRKVKKTFTYAKVSYIVLLISAAVFLYYFWNFQIIPQKYKLPITAILVIVLALMGIYSFYVKPHYKGKKIFVSFMNILLSALLIGGSVFFPYVQGRISKIFNHGILGDDKNYLNIFVYSLSAEYKSAHPEIFDHTETATDLADYIDRTFIIQNSVDQENQATAITLIKTELAVDSIFVYEAEDVLSAVDALYQNEGDVIILNESWAESLSGLEGYDSFLDDTVIVYTAEVENTAEPSTIDDNTDDQSHVLQILCAGSDTRSTVLSEYGRTDVVIMLTVNLDTHQILMVSIPRDYYINNPALGGMDKLTHLGNSGIANTMLGLNEKFGVSLSDYAIVNFYTFEAIIDALGGVDIYNPYGFYTELIGGMWFEEGSLHLNGEQALAYVRERHNLPNGDFGRNEHQAIILQALIDKVTSMDMLSNFNSVLNALQGKVLTSFSGERIMNLISSMVNNYSAFSIISYHLSGVGDYQGTASMGWDRLLYVAWPVESQVQFIQREVQKMVIDEIITQETLPN